MLHSLHSLLTPLLAAILTTPLIEMIAGLKIRPASHFSQQLAGEEIVKARKKKRDRGDPSSVSEQIDNAHPDPTKKKKKNKKVHPQTHDQEDFIPELEAPRLDAEEVIKRKNKRKKQADTGAIEPAQEATDPNSGPIQVDAEEVAKKNKKKKNKPANDTSAFRNEHKIMISDNYPANTRPCLNFEDTTFHSSFTEYFRRSNFSKPTPIQCECWPILNLGLDIVGIAQTGSGKTLAFALPGMQRLLSSRANQSAKGVRMLILCPTRELAQQCAHNINEAGSEAGLVCVCVHGGVAKDHQRRGLRGGASICVATPGRLKDLLEEGGSSLGQVTYCVLDEADRMLDMGFEHDVRSILSHTHRERQTAMFSATWPKGVQSIAAELMKHPVKVTIGGEELSSNRSVTQIVEVVDRDQRDRKLLELLTRYHTGENRVLVFVLYKKEADRVEQFLRGKGWANVCVHGDKSQNERERAINQFAEGSCALLVATDVATRGLDIADVEYVINYSFPLTVEDYIHRIGRTGRAGKTGIAHTLFHDGDKLRAGELVNVLRQAGQEVPESLLRFGTTVKRKEHKLYGAFAREVDTTKKPTKITFESDDDS